MTDTICKGCGHPFSETGTHREPIGRRHSERHGWHNATTLACSWCGTYRRWDAPIPRTVDEVRQYAAGHGSRMFDADTMHFFRSRLLDGVTVSAGRVYFVTSERDVFAPKSSRDYTIRSMSAGAHFDKVGEFGDYATAKQARAALKDYLASPRVSA